MVVLARMTSPGVAGDASRRAEVPNPHHINRQPPAGFAWASTVEPLAVPTPRAPAATGLSRSAIYREAAKGNLRLRLEHGTHNAGVGGSSPPAATSS